MGRKRDLAGETSRESGNRKKGRKQIDGRRENEGRKVVMWGVTQHRLLQKARKRAILERLKGILSVNNSLSGLSYRLLSQQ